MSDRIYIIWLLSLCLWFIAARLCSYALTTSVRRTSVRLLSVMCTLFFNSNFQLGLLTAVREMFSSILLVNEVIVKYVSGSNQFN